METQTLETGRPLTNREMASLLFNIATVLRDAGNVNPYRTAAYERGARALMGLRQEAREILDTADRVPFRRRQHIGKKLQAKIHEMVAQGDLAQYREMLATLPAHYAELLAVPGMGPRSADRVYESLGIGTREELVRAARDGRLRTVPGFGPRRTAQIAALPMPGDVRQGSLFELPITA